MCPGVQTHATVRPKIPHTSLQQSLFAWGLVTHNKEYAMSLGTILLVILILLLIGAIPTWPHSRGWGYGPSGGLGVLVVILVVLLVTGRL